MAEPGGTAGSLTAEGLRVLVVSGLYPRPGTPRSGLFVHRQVAALREQGVDARVLCPVVRHALPFRRESEFAATLDSVREERVEGVPVSYVPYRHVPHRLSTRLEAASLLRSVRGYAGDVFEERPDVIHAHWLFPAGHAAVALASEWGVPSVVTAHGSDVHRYPAENRGVARFTRRTLRRADAVVAVCRALEREIQELVDGAASVSVIYNGVDTAQFRVASDRNRSRAAVGLPEAGPGICCVCRLVEEKGVLELLEAFGRLASDRPELWLALVGDGPLREKLRSVALERDVSDRVFLPGGVPHRDVASWMQASDLFALPSHAEGLPVVVLEAMACGLPVVATDVGGTAEAVDDRVGRLVPPRDVDRLAEALDELLEDPGASRRMGVEGARRVRQRFTWSRSARDLARLYADVAGPGANTAARERRTATAADRGRR
jgi:glycosyltransferase involved in cell wall biosynthesis